MKYGRSLQDVAAEIERQAASKQDFIAPTKQLRMLDDGKTLEIEHQGQFGIADLALTQIGDRAGIPTKYLRRMQQEAPQLLATNVNHWFKEQPERRLVRTLDGDARAFLSDRYNRIDNLDVAHAVLPVLFKVPGLKIISTEVTEHRLYIKASTSLITGVVKSRRVGDIVEAGAMITNSEVGLGAIKVSPYANFLICLNGMTRDGGQKWAHLGRVADDSDEAYALLTDETKEADDRALLLKVRDTLTGALDERRFQAWLAKLEGTTENKIEGDVNAAVEVLSNKLNFSLDEKSSVLRHLIEGADLSQYGLINAVTRTAEDAGSYDRATELETAGATVLDLKAHEWREIAKAEAQTRRAA